jgi:hypothetical protein
MNLFQPVIAQAIAQGVSEETIVLLLLLPLVASLVAAARHLIGFRGFGILIPMAMAVTFVAIGMGTGIFVFLVILSIASLMRRVLEKFRLHYLPRMALLLWFVSLGILGLIFIAPYLNLGQLMTISIFTIIILILLAEEFIAVQINKSLREAARLTGETVILAFLGYLIFSLDLLKNFALNYPLWVILIPFFFNLWVGRFTGLRLIEYWRFRKILR